MPTVVATPGASNANSFITVDELTAYIDAHLPVPEIDKIESPEALVIMATRVIVASLSPFRRFVPPARGIMAYYVQRRTWTGQATLPTQSLPWPRTGMFDRNGNVIDPMVIPSDLKDATAELCIGLARNDLTLDNDVSVQGIQSIRAGSVSLSFFGNTIGEATTKMLPDMVLFLLVPSWLTDELFEPAQSAFVQLL